MTETALGRVFVMGGTGMLAPAVHWIARHATSLTLAARQPQTLADDVGATGLKLDWNAAALAKRALASRQGRFDVAVIWLHEAAAALARPCEEVVTKGGRVIRVHGSLAADPMIRRLRDPDPRGDVIKQEVILGYHPDPSEDDGKRWLSDVEISGGVIAALRDPGVKTLTVGTACGV